MLEDKELIKSAISESWLVVLIAGKVVTNKWKVFRTVLEDVLYDLGEVMADDLIFRFRKAQLRYQVTGKAFRFNLDVYFGEETSSSLEEEEYYETVEESLIYTEFNCEMDDLVSKLRGNFHEARERFLFLQFFLEWFQGNTWPTKVMFDLRFTWSDFPDFGDMVAHVHEGISGQYSKEGILEKVELIYQQGAYLDFEACKASASEGGVLPFSLENLLEELPEFQALERNKVIQSLPEKFLGSAVKQLTELASMGEAPSDENYN